MCQPRWFYRNDDEWVALVERLKLTPCPHCRAVGTLIRHGSLHGFDDQTPPRKVLRARRIFCSNRHRRPGCGRTVSVFRAETIRRSSLSAHTLLAVLRHAVAVGIAAATRAVKTPLSARTLQRIGKRFDLAQSRLRTALLGRGPPPEGPYPPVRRPAAAHVLAHLDAAFPPRRKPDRRLSAGDPIRLPVNPVVTEFSSPLRTLARRDGSEKQRQRQVSSWDAVPSGSITVRLPTPQTRENAVEVTVGLSEDARPRCHRHRSGPHPPRTDPTRRRLDLPRRGGELPPVHLADHPNLVLPLSEPRHYQQ